MLYVGSELRGTWEGGESVCVLHDSYNTAAVCDNYIMRTLLFRGAILKSCFTGRLWNILFLAPQTSCQAHTWMDVKSSLEWETVGALWDIHAAGTYAENVCCFHGFAFEFFTQNLLLMHCWPAEDVCCCISSWILSAKSSFIFECFALFF